MPIEVVTWMSAIVQIRLGYVFLLNNGAMPSCVENLMKLHKLEEVEVSVLDYWTA